MKIMEVKRKKMLKNIVISLIAAVAALFILPVVIKDANVSAGENYDYQGELGDKITIPYENAKIGCLSVVVLKAGQDPSTAKVVEYDPNLEGGSIDLETGKVTRGGYTFVHDENGAQGAIGGLKTISSESDKQGTLDYMLGNKGILGRTLPSKDGGQTLETEKYDNGMYDVYILNLDSATWSTKDQEKQWDIQKLCIKKVTVKMYPKAKYSMDPMALNSKDYNGKEQELVRAGVTSQGTVLYSIDNGEYTTEVPKAKDAGEEHTLSWYIKGDSTHTDSNPETVDGVKIDPISIEVEWSGGDFTYDGTQKTVTASITNIVDTDKSKGVTVTMEGNKETAAGDYTAKVTSVNNKNYYVGRSPSCTKNWKINPKNISGANITLGEELTYSGTPQTKSVTSVSVDNLRLNTGDYETTDNTKTEAGEYNLKVTGKGNFTGEAKKSFSIKKRKVEIKWNEPDLTYDRTSKKVTASVANVAEGEGAAVELTVSGNTGTDAADYNAKVTGVNNNNYTTEGADNLAYSWKIKPRTIDTVTLKEGDLTYNGQLQTKEISNVSAGGIELKDGEYTFSGNTATNAGMHNMTITSANSNFTGTKEEVFEIKKKPITSAKVTLGEQLTYNGEEQEQKVTSVVVDGIELTEDDYTVDNHKRTDAGDQNLKIKATGNFEGEIEQAFTVSKRPITSAKVTLGEQLTYTGEEQEQKVTSVVVDGIELTEEDDYTVDNHKRTDAGDQKLKIKATGNFDGEVEQEFTVNKLPIDVSWQNTENLVYNGNTHKITPVVNNLCGEDEVSLITDGTEAVSAGTYTAKVTGIGGSGPVVFQVNNSNYTTQGGRGLEKEWVIAQGIPVEGRETTAEIDEGKPLKDADLNEGEILDSNGEPIEGEFTWKDPDKIISEGGKEIVIFTPKNPNYAPIEIEVYVNVRTAAVKEPLLLDFQLNNNDNSQEGTDTGVRTGDESNIALWCVVAIVSAGGILTALYTKKRAGR